MNLRLKKTQHIILGLVSLVLSRLTFMLIDDPEGPNLLIVVGLALVIYVFFLALYLIYYRLKK